MTVATRLPFEPASVGAARRALAPLDRAVDEATKETLYLLVSELVTNSVRHGRSEGGGEIELSASASPDKVRVEVADPGPGFAARPRADGQDQGSGWGLHLVDALSNRWGTERDGRMRIWFELDVPPLTAAA
jgi:anti-sigma regulatory factor (Ser/Thr protein kinase)